MNSGHAFVWMDRYLETAQAGPRYLPSLGDAREQQS